MTKRMINPPCRAIACGLLWLATVALAEPLPENTLMYVWTDPDSGRLHYSGQAPPWLQNPSGWAGIPGLAVDSQGNYVLPPASAQNPSPPALPPTQIYQNGKLITDSRGDSADLLRQQEKIRQQQQREQKAAQIEELIGLKKIDLGFDKASVERAWGKPAEITLAEKDGEKEETWHYPDAQSDEKNPAAPPEVTFVNGKVIRFRQAAEP